MRGALPRLLGVLAVGRAGAFNVPSKLYRGPAFRGFGAAAHLAQGQKQHQFVSLAAAAPAPGAYTHTSSRRTMASSSVSADASPKALASAEEVLSFWFGDPSKFETLDAYKEAYMPNWFMGATEEFEKTQTLSSDLVEEAAKGSSEVDESSQWAGPRGALARILLLDQFPRCIYRGDPKAFQYAELAESLGKLVVEKEWDLTYSHFEKTFAYLPFMHSESLELHDLCVEKTKAHLPGSLEFAQDHRDVVAKFGRFPHRNKALGRESTPEEAEWLSSDDLPGWVQSQMK